MNDQPIKKQTFLQGTAVLAMATVLVKLMGFLFKVPLNNIIGEDGFGYFNTAYDVYNVLLMISTTGLPVAMSRMISQAQTLGNHAQIRRIYRTSLYVFLTIGMVGSLGMLFFCRQLSVMVTTNENSWAAIAALAPCVLLICLVSAYRGFFQGQSNMTPTSVSQIFEAVTRLVVGLGLAWLVMKLTGEAAVRAQGIVLASGETAQDYGDITLAAGGAILGVTLGSLISVVYLHHKFRQSNQILSLGGGTAKSTRSTMKELLSIAVPITLGSAGLQIINLFDTMIYMRRLTGALQWTEKMADSAKGVYNFCQTVFALPCSFIPTITIAVIPAITASLTRKDLAEAKGTSESSRADNGAHCHAVRGGAFRDGRAGHPAALLDVYGRSHPACRNDARDSGTHSYLQLPRSAAQRHHAGARGCGHAGRQHAHRRHHQDHRELYSRRAAESQHCRRADRHVHLLHLDHGARPDCYEAAHFRPSGNFQKHHKARSCLCNHGRSNIHGVPRSVERDLLVEACVPSEPRVCSGFVRGSGGLPAVSDV